MSGYEEYFYIAFCFAHRSDQIMQMAFQLQQLDLNLVPKLWGDSVL